jgi:hypothetical protein
MSQKRIVEDMKQQPPPNKKEFGHIGGPNAPVQTLMNTQTSNGLGSGAYTNLLQDINNQSIKLNNQL